MKRVSFIGSGNVATHLAKGLYAAGMEVVHVFSRDENHAKKLANEVNAQAITRLRDLKSDETDVIIISVKDDVIQQVAELFESGSTIVVHTSGTVGLNVLQNHVNNGVFYPLQTFSKNSEMSLSNVPFCLEANSKETMKDIFEMAGRLSSNVQEVNESVRKTIHLSAVFACNFTNHMWAIADEILKESDQDLSILSPLIKETVDKALQNHPVDVQTGPAVREDQEVMNSHIKRLGNNPDFVGVYKEVSQSIIKLKKHE